MLLVARGAHAFTQLKAGDRTARCLLDLVSHFTHPLPYGGYMFPICSQDLIYDHDVLYIKNYADTVFKAIYLKAVRKKGYELLSDKDPPKKKHLNDFKLDNNLSRARTSMIEYALCNPFEYFFTGTIDSKKYNRYEYRKYIKDLSKFFNNYKNRHSKDFIYLIVPELHKDGAIHIHGFLGGLNPKDIITNKNGYLEWTSYSQKFGFMSFSPLRDKERTAYYCTKYITKDIEKIVGRNQQIFRCSKGLKKAEITKLCNVDSHSIDWDYIGEYASVKTSHDLEEILSQITLLEGAYEFG